MCTLFNVAATAANLIVTAVEVKEAYDTKKEAKYQANVLTKQAEKAKIDAANERQDGIEEARRKRLKSILNMGKEKTTMAAGNISLNSQTALNVVDDEKLNGELDALITLKDSEKRADKYMEKADDLYSDAALTSFKAKKAFSNSVMNSFSNTLRETVKLFDGKE